MKLRGLMFTVCLAAVVAIAGCNCPSSEKKCPAAAEAPKAAQPAATQPAPQPAAAPKPAEAPKPAAPVAANKGFAMRVNCGATDPFTDSKGRVWLADQEMGEGKTWGTDDGMTSDREGVGVTGTDIVKIYETERYSMGSYKFTVPNGPYTVRLHFCETYDGITAAGERVFSVSLQGQVVLKDLDLVKEVGSLKPLVKEYKGINVTDGKIAIAFTPNVENPEINGIEILAAESTWKQVTSNVAGAALDHSWAALFVDCPRLDSNQHRVTPTSPSS